MAMKVAHNEEVIHEKYSEDVKKQKSVWKEITTKLITKEDANHFHKILGALVLCSFIYRYLIVYPMQGDLGIDSGWFSWLTMFIHLALSCTSLLFHVLTRRLLNRPMIIWEEYRQHAIVFTLRAFSVFVFGVVRPFNPANGWDPNLEYAALFCLVLAHHLVVDEISRRHGSSQHTTVRVHDSYSLAVTIILRFYAFYQVVGFASYMALSEHMCELGYNTFIAIQSSAFLMTLYRKNLIVGRTHGFWYTLALVISMYHMFRILGIGMFLLKASTVYVLRTQFRVNKYICWAGFTLVSTPWFAEQVTAQMDTFSQLYQEVFRSVPLPSVAMLNLLVLLFPVYKIVTGYYANKK